MQLEDELGDILQKARDGKCWSQADLGRATGLPNDVIRRIESYQWMPEDPDLLKLAEALDLDGTALIDVARERWMPQEPADDPEFDLVCLNVFMGEYPVKCYLLRCKATDETAVVDTGANPKTIINKAREMALAFEAFYGTLAAVRASAVDDPEDPMGRSVGLGRHDLSDEAAKRLDAGFGFAAAEDFRSVDIPGGQIGESSASGVLVFDSHVARLRRRQPRRAVDDPHACRHACKASRDDGARHADDGRGSVGGAGQHALMAGDRGAISYRREETSRSRCTPGHPRDGLRRIPSDRCRWGRRCWR